MNLREIFEKHESEYIQFHLIENKFSNRPDIHAFILLDKIIPGKSDIVAAAEHDQIFLEVELDELAEKATEEQIIELIRCGVRLSTEVDSLSMWV